MGEVIFKGGAPYDLPSGQSAAASALDETVEATFVVLVPDQQRAKEIRVRIRLTPGTALMLADQLKSAAMMAEQNARDR